MESNILEYLTDGQAHTFKEIADGTPYGAVKDKRNVLARLIREGQIAVVKNDQGVPIRPPTYRKV